MAGDSTARAVRIANNKLVFFDLTFTKRIAMQTNELREKYLEFFQTKGHQEVPSDVLVPTWDPTVLFTPAGMNQFKDHFLGKVELDFTRATTCQKCLRTGDIDNVGRTAYHHTFFEMLGNFSFGDYFKKEAIHYAWEFLTDKKWLGIAPDQLTVTVYQDDDEAFGIWNKEIGLSADRISRLDEYENFWPAGAPTDGPDGVCGPCSEIFYHPIDGPEVEIWNLVFTQFERVGTPPDNLQPLPRKNIDTGMGLERIAATLQGVSTNYHIDLLQPIVDAAAEVCGTRYEYDGDNGRRLRRITDHVRACTFSIHENVYPGPNKENYVVKRLLRRAVLDGHQMGMRSPFLRDLVSVVVDQMKVAYPEMQGTAERVAAVMENEERSFFDSIDGGLERIEKIFAEMKKVGCSVVDGEAAAELYQTYGVPPELFEQIASERECTFGWSAYRDAMQRHSDISGTLSDGVMGNAGPVDELKVELKSSSFVGYESTEHATSIGGLVDGDQRVDCLTIPGQEQKQLLFLLETPFYAESGGQVGDTGSIVGPEGEFQVEDTLKTGDLVCHEGRMVRGVIAQGDAVVAKVDIERRDAICRAHSATHILHEALQQQLGTHAQQRGSKVTNDELRFDFTNLEPVSEQALLDIEQQSQQRIEQARAVQAETLPLAVAKQKGAMMLFGEKYPDPVRMVSMGEFSKELCGGTHLSNTSDVGHFEIISEEAVASGTRRIVVYTGGRAQRHAQAIRNAVQCLLDQLGVTPQDVLATVDAVSKRVKQLKKILASGKRNASDDAVTVIVNQTVEMSYQETRRLLRQTARLLNVPLFAVVERVEALQHEMDSLEKQISQQSDTEIISADDLLAGAPLIDGVRLVVSEVMAGNPNLLRGLIDQIRKKQPSAAVMLVSITGPDKLALVAGIGNDLLGRGLHAGNWVKEVAPTVGGGGGGKPDLAQAGGKQPDKIHVALDAARNYIRAELAK